MTLEVKDVRRGPGEIGGRGGDRKERGGQIGS